VYLEVAPHISLGLVKKRSETTGQKMDIHEKDPDYMERCYEAAMYVSDHLGWERIRCYDETGILPREAIHEEILKKVLAL
jgi:dTMP kinase